MDITAEEQSKEQGMRRMDSLRDPWGKLKYTNIRKLGDPEEEIKGKGLRKFLKRL